MKKELNCQKKEKLTGRSMVEMLGVLAIIGILSIVAFTGYTIAINKYKADEILNGASIRAAEVSIRLQQNSEANLTEILSDFTDNTVAGATFSNEVTKSGDNFSLSVSDVAIDVCNQIKDIVDTTTSNVNVNSDCSIFTYMIDLSNPVVFTTSYDGATTDDGSDCSTSTRLGGVSGCQVCSKGSWIDSNAKCTNAGSTCVDGQCTTLTKTCPVSGKCGTTGNCTTTIVDCKKDSDCAGSTYDSNLGMCVRDANADPDETACAKNSDCKIGEFCNYYGNVSCTTGPNGKVGRCDDASSSAYVEITSSDYMDLTGSNWILSDPIVDWYSARNFCQANHMQMVGLSDIGCTTTTCTWSKFSGKLLGDRYVVWVNNLDGGAGSCKTYRVHIRNKNIRSARRDNGISGDYWVLCK